MVMYSTGATRRFAESGLQGSMHFTFCPSDTLETLYCGTTPGSQFRVCPHLSTIVAGLRRSRRLQYVKKSVNNLHLRRRMYASVATLLGQPGPQRGPLPHLQLGSLSGSLRGPHPAPQLGLQRGRRREYQCFGATADLKTIRTVGGLQSYLDVRNQQRTEHKNNQLLQSLAVPCTFYEKEGARAFANKTLCAIVKASRRQQQQ